MIFDSGIECVDTTETTHCPSNLFHLPTASFLVRGVSLSLFEYAPSRCTGREFLASFAWSSLVMGTFYLAGTTISVGNLAGLVFVLCLFAFFAYLLDFFSDLVSIFSAHNIIEKTCHQVFNRLDDIICV